MEKTLNMLDYTKTYSSILPYDHFIEDFEKTSIETLFPQQKRFTITALHPENNRTDTKMLKCDIYDTDNNDLSQRIINEEVKTKTLSFEKDFIAATKGIFIESGCAYDFELAFEKYYKKNKFVAIKLLSNLLHKYYSDDLNVVTAILHTVSHYSYSDLGEAFVFQVLSLCNHRNKKIKKFALKIFDNWDNVETLPLLEGTSALRERWLENYRQNIIKHLEGKKDGLLGASN